jgi:hypothetical protein
MDLAETIAALFEQKSPGVLVYRRKVSLLASRAAVGPVVLIGVLGAGVALLVARTAWDGAMFAILVLMIEVMFLKQMELEIDCGARRVGRRWRLCTILHSWVCLWPRTVSS